MPLYTETHLLSEEDYENMDKDEEEEYEVIKIETLEQISQNSQKERCNEILQKFKKKNNVLIRAEYSALSILIILWSLNSNYRCKI